MIPHFLSYFQKKKGPLRSEKWNSQAKSIHIKYLQNTNNCNNWESVQRNRIYTKQFSSECERKQFALNVINSQKTPSHTYSLF